MVKALFIILFLIIPTISLLNGMLLSNIHLIFYLIALTLFIFNKNNLSVLIDMINNIKTLKVGNFLLFEKQVKEFKEMSKNIEVQKTENLLNISLNEKYSDELLLSRLNYNYNLINSHIRQIYSLVYNDNVSDIDTIVIFDYLRQKQILNNNFCTYLYDVCSTIAEYLKTPQRKEITNDLIAISADIIENLISVENYINTNLKKLYTDIS